MRHAAIAFVLFGWPALALDVESRVDNFELLDHAGAAHELHYLSDMRAVVLMSHANACPEQADAVAALNAARDAYESGGVAFLMVNSGDARGEITERAGDFGIGSPVLLDEAGIVGASLGFTHAAETLVVRTNDWRVAWRGAPGGLANALEAVLAESAMPAAETLAAVTGCEIAYPEATVASYSDTIAPLLADNCVTCHRQGGIGPWAMTDYNMIRGFSPMIREVIRTRRMPPWHADPAYGHFANDRSLEPEEVRTLVAWIEAGSPRGEGPDPLAELDREWPTWGLGEPDLVIDIPPYEVPASGVVEYQYPRVVNPLDRDVWVRATEIQPGDRQALHHVITRFYTPNPEAEGGFGRRGGGLGGYVPGSVVRQYPPDTGTLLPAGARIVFQMHYTPYGKAITDGSKLGIYLHDEPPKYQLGGTTLVNTKIRIPPHAKAHSESKSEVLERDVLLYSLLPHAHYRGKASDFVAHYPDGSSEVLLSVPNYDFNWQTSYVLRNPKMLPAGTRIVHTTTWDNSTQNPANPDPDREVPWGLQSWDEMLFGAVSFRYLEAEETDSSEGFARFQGSSAGE
ncbi:MAG: redoxin domain-containing protein [Gammaproteobacteria bacterium]|nr:redoxin domain-containing protein [Gammaproteobacteria bacterium]